MPAFWLEEIQGQTVQQFFDSHDGGRDGAFGGVWQHKVQENFSGQFTAQCKFTAKSNTQLSQLDLRDELKKAKRLATKKLAEPYILMTNARFDRAGEMIAL